MSLFPPADSGVKLKRNSGKGERNSGNETPKHPEVGEGGGVGGGGEEERENCCLRSSRDCATWHMLVKKETKSTSVFGSGG